MESAKKRRICQYVINSDGAHSTHKGNKMYYGICRRNYKGSVLNCKAGFVGIGISVQAEFYAAQMPIDDNIKNKIVLQIDCYERTIKKSIAGPTLMLGELRRRKLNHGGDGNLSVDDLSFVVLLLLEYRSNLLIESDQNRAVIVVAV
ncbi:hypothetical protein ACFE04_030693 [Oxalis oulophora]